MKNLSVLLILSFISIGLFSCKKEEEKSATASGLLEERLSAGGQWGITYFYSDSLDQTAQFTDYSFTFDKNHHLAFANSLLTANGEWTTGENQTVTDLDLNLTATEGNDQAGKVAGNWEVAAQSDTQLALQRNVDGHPQQVMNLQKIK